MSSGVKPPSQNFEPLFLSSLVLYPVLFGSTDLWGFSLATLVLCGGFSFHWFTRARHEPVLKSRLDAWLGLYAVFFILSLAFSKIAYLSWVEFFKLNTVLCAFIATRYVCRERPQIYRAAEMFVFMGALLSGIGLLQFVGGIPNGWWSHPQFLSSMYVNHNHFAGLLVLLIPVTFGMVMAERDRSKKVLFSFIMVLMGVAFVFALSRGALVALGAAMIAMMGLLRSRRLISSSLLPFLMFVLLVVAAVAVLGTDSIEERIGNIRAMTQEEELSLLFRWLTWVGTLPMIAAYFWFGSGPGTFGHLFLQFRPFGFSMRPVHTHNDALQLLAECGIFSFAAATVLLVLFFVFGLKVIRRDESRFRIGLGSGILAGTLGLLVHSLFDFNFHIPANWLLSSVAAALLFTMDKEETYGPRASKSLKILISGMLLAAVSGALYLGISDYRLWEARKLIQAGNGRGAVEAVEKSLHLNPFNPEGYYIRGYSRSEGIEASVRDFDKAIALNPYEPVYDLAKAHTLAPRLAAVSPAELVLLYEKALRKDPNNETLASAVARDTFGRSGPQFVPLRALAGKMLATNKASLAGLVAYLEKSDHWQYHRPYYLAMNGINPDQLSGMGTEKYLSDGVSYPADAFVRSDGEAAGKDGVLYSNVTLTKTIDFHRPASLLTLECKASRARGVYPVLYVKIDGKLVDEHYVNSEGFMTYYTSLRLEPGVHLLSIAYVNDLRAGGLSAEDRNVWVRQVTLRGTV